MGMFIHVEVDRGLCTAPGGCSQCEKVCPVDILRIGPDGLVVDPENEDECTLCDLCLEACKPGALRIVKLYEEG